MMAETRIVEPEGTAISRERQINAFLRQRICDTTVEELLEMVFSAGLDLRQGRASSQLRVLSCGCS
jgi:hypothetical protein